MTRVPPRSSLLLVSALVLGGLFSAGCSSTKVIEDKVSLSAKTEKYKVNLDGTPHRSEINNLTNRMGGPAIIDRFDASASGFPIGFWS